MLEQFNRLNKDAEECMLEEYTQRGGLKKRDMVSTKEHRQYLENEEQMTKVWRHEPDDLSASLKIIQ